MFYIDKNDSLSKSQNIKSAFFLDSNFSHHANSNEYPPLLTTCMNGDLRVVKHIIEKENQSTNAVMGWYSLLELAIYSQNELLIDYLIEKKANTKTRNEKTKMKLMGQWFDCDVDFSPLVMAIKRKNLKLVQKMIQNGAQVDKLYYGYYSIYYAVNTQPFPIAKYLIEHDASFHDTHSNKIYEKSVWSYFNTFSHFKKNEIIYPLYYSSIRRGDIEMLELFKSQKIDFKKQMNQQLTVFHELARAKISNDKTDKAFDSLIENDLASISIIQEIMKLP